MRLNPAEGYSAFATSDTGGWHNPGQGRGSTRRITPKLTPDIGRGHFDKLLDRQPALASPSPAQKLQSDHLSRSYAVGLLALSPWELKPGTEAEPWL
jgi:hypothetical protein